MSSLSEESSWRLLVQQPQRGTSNNEQHMPQLLQFPASFRHTCLKTEFYGHSRLEARSLFLYFVTVKIKSPCQPEVRGAPFQRHSGLRSTREAGKDSVGHRMPQRHFPIVIHGDIRNPRLRFRFCRVRLCSRKNGCAHAIYNFPRLHCISSAKHQEAESTIMETSTTCRSPVGLGTCMLAKFISQKILGPLAM